MATKTAYEDVSVQVEDDLYLQHQDELDDFPHLDLDDIDLAVYEDYIEEQSLYGRIKETLDGTLDSIHEYASDRLPMLDGSEEERQFIGELVAGLPAYMIGGVVGAEVADLYTDTAWITTGASLTAAYVAGLVPVMGLHISSNQDRYQDEEDDWSMKEVVKDFGRLQVSLGVAKVTYGAVRAGTTYGLLAMGAPPSAASLAGDLAASPAYYLAAPAPARWNNFLDGEDDELDTELDDLSDEELEEFAAVDLDWHKILEEDGDVSDVSA